MLINPNHNVTSYPVFPTWVFEHALSLEPRVQRQLLKNVDQLPVDSTHYGWKSQANHLTVPLQKIRQVAGSVFYDTAINHFRIPENCRNIDSINSHIYCIKPGHCSPITVNKLRWYQCAVLLSNHDNTCDIQLNRFDASLHCNLGIVSKDIELIPATYLKIVFWPAYIPWHFTVNNSDKDVYIYTNTFMFKGKNP